MNIYLQLSDNGLFF